jgi:hypothetical protein
MNTKTNERATAVPPSEADWLEVVRRNVSGLRYGSVQIIVHEGRVTQIESLEKTRFNANREEPGSPDK